MSTDCPVQGVDSKPIVPPAGEVRASGKAEKEIKLKTRAVIADKELHRDVKGLERAAGMGLGDDVAIPEIPAASAISDEHVEGDDELNEEVRVYARRLRAWLASLKVTDNQKKLMLVGIATHGTVSNAALRMGTSPNTHYKWIRDDTEYAAAAREATEMVADRLESEAIRRATKGVTRPVYHKGEQIGVVRNYSDLLLIFMLKAMRPEKYREKFEVDQRSVTANVNVDIDYGKLSTGELLEFKRLMSKVAPEDDVPRLETVDGNPENQEKSE